MEKNTLITGVAGFLGSSLAKDLLRKGLTVIGLDNLSTGKIQNLDSIMTHPNFFYFYADVCSPEIFEMKELVKTEEIYHLASPASPKFYQTTPFKTIEVNTLGTKNMLKLAKRNSAKIVYTSTSEVYGDPEVHPQNEQYSGSVKTWGPRACYDESKRLGEVFCFLYYTQHGVKVKVARLFNTYSFGLRNDDGRVISNFVTQAINNEDITVYGDGKQTRSFCYVSDTVNALQLMMEKEEANGEIINVGNPDEFSVLAIAKMIKKLANSSSNITFNPLPLDDPRKRRPNIDKAKRLLGWEPKVSLEEGLINTINAYRKNNNNG
ncbi:GDP-mannose 4,6-dehydratase [Thalassorhabdus alkalitolerans]|uniref:UDP-glucuronate decarboxylase n=1 Tax=Thalassorhabdus alkalitolerans TaxID=2282697 RepID=A0ABW0YKR7_9BACI